MDNHFNPLEVPEVSGNLSVAIDPPAISENLVDEYLEILSPPTTEEDI
jgi:hypothetical protein